MTTTCQDLVARARGFSILNSSLTSDSAEMLSRLRADQRAIRAEIAAQTRDFFQTTYALGSTTGAANRVADLTALDPPLERILKVELRNSGMEISQVDVLDPDAELSPRYTVRGTSLIEWKNEWNTGSATAVALTITYVSAPRDIDPAGAMTQVVSIPDEWCDLLALLLAAYCVHKDVGRDSAEYDRLMTIYQERFSAFLEYLSHYGGVESRRFDLPGPSRTKK